MKKKNPTDREMLEVVIKNCKPELPDGGVHFLLGHPLTLRGFLLSMEFARKFFGDRVIGYVENAREGKVETRTPIPMWFEGIRTAAVQGNALKFYYNHVLESEQSNKK